MQQRATTRPHTERPLYKMSVQLIDTYKLINKVYYEKKLRRKAEKPLPPPTTASGKSEWDDENHDYVVRVEDSFGEHYVIKERIGKGSFGQVVRAKDARTNTEVAIKIIKSKKPFALQARTEIELLEALKATDRDDGHNLVRLLEHFHFRGHQCLVFELLSYNLYELLKNTQFHGVSLNLVRKFAKQILTALSFLAKPDVSIIHCDLKPENILLRHPKRSAIKVIDFGSSCRADRRMYSYIQSRFYRSPEVMLGLPYTVAIDVWSLGCILVEMHTGEPLFSGADQLDQMRKLVDVLGMLPDSMIEAADSHCRDQFFHHDGQGWRLRRRTGDGGPPSSSSQTTTTTTNNNNNTEDSSNAAASSAVADSKKKTTTQARQQRHAGRQQAGQSGSSSSTTTTTHHGDDKARPTPTEGALLLENARPPRGVASVVGRSNGGPGGRRRGEPGHGEANYDLFLDLVHRMLDYSPTTRIKPDDALRHSFLNDSVWASTHVLTASANHRHVVARPRDVVVPPNNPWQTDHQVWPATATGGTHRRPADAATGAYGGKLLDSAAPNKRHHYLPRNQFTQPLQQPDVVVGLPTGMPPPAQAHAHHTRGRVAQATTTTTQNGQHNGQQHAHHRNTSGPPPPPARLPYAAVVAESANLGYVVAFCACLLTLSFPAGPFSRGASPHRRPSRRAGDGIPTRPTCRWTSTTAPRSTT